MTHCTKMIRMCLFTVCLLKQWNKFRLKLLYIIPGRDLFRRNVFPENFCSPSPFLELLKLFFFFWLILCRKVRLYTWLSWQPSSAESFCSGWMWRCNQRWGNSFVNEGTFNFLFYNKKQRSDCDERIQRTLQILWIAQLSNGSSKLALLIFSAALNRGDCGEKKCARMQDDRGWHFTLVWNRTCEYFLFLEMQTGIPMEMWLLCNESKKKRGIKPWFDDYAHNSKHGVSTENQWQFSTNYY